MTRRKAILNLFNFAIVILACISVYAFFQPWVIGTGSVLKPIDDATSAIQNIDKTGLAKGIMGVSKSITDEFFNFFSKGKMKQVFSGYEIPRSNNPQVKKLGSIVYLVYVPPALAVLCAILSIMGNKKPALDFLTFLIALGTYVITQNQMVSINRKSLFIVIESSDGFLLMVHALLGISICTFLKLFFHSKRRSL